MDLRQSLNTAFRVWSEPDQLRPHLQRQRSNILNRALVDLVPTFSTCNPRFRYLDDLVPKRALTQPSEGVSNGGFDNENFDYILYVNDLLGMNHQYVILDLVGQGTFGQVVKAQSTATQEIVAIKVLKNKAAYMNQGLLEIQTLVQLNTADPSPPESSHIVKLLDYFVFRHHLCLVFELLSVNLYELLKSNKFRGLSPQTCRILSQRLLHSLVLLYNERIIHCDLKPENVLLRKPSSSFLKLIDFGSACQESYTVYTYIQSRHYRAPEVLFRCGYTCAIDMWSFGCVVAELFIGLPLFPGTSEYSQVARLVEMLGLPPESLLETGKNTYRYFTRTPAGDWDFRPKEEYEQKFGIKVQPNKRYFEGTTLEDVIKLYPYKSKLSAEERVAEAQQRESLIDFLGGCLQWDPHSRWTPMQALQHPFLTGAPYTGRFVPPPTPSRPWKPTQNILQQLPLHHILSNSNPAVPADMAIRGLDQRFAQLGISPQVTPQLGSFNASPTGPSITTGSLPAHHFIPPSYDNPASQPKSQPKMRQRAPSEPVPPVKMGYSPPQRRQWAPEGGSPPKNRPRATSEEDVHRKSFDDKSARPSKPKGQVSKRTTGRRRSQGPTTHDMEWGRQRAGLETDWRAARTEFQSRNSPKKTPSKSKPKGGKRRSQEVPDNEWDAVFRMDGFDESSDSSFQKSPPSDSESGGRFLFTGDQPIYMSPYGSAPEFEHFALGSPPGYPGAPAWTPPENQQPRRFPPT